MRWRRLKGQPAETWALRGLRIRAQGGGFELYEAQRSLDGLGFSLKGGTFGTLDAAKKHGKEKLKGL